MTRSSPNPARFTPTPRGRLEPALPAAPAAAKSSATAHPTRLILAASAGYAPARAAVRSVRAGIPGFARPGGDCMRGPSHLQHFNVRVLKRGRSLQWGDFQTSSLTTREEFREEEFRTADVTWAP